MPIVSFENYNVCIDVESGATVMQAVRRAGLTLDAPCGGNGTCRKCKVKVDKQDVLACQCRIYSDVRVEMPRKQETDILTDGRSMTLSPDPIAPGYLLAFDIGTTTVVCFLLSPEGEELATYSMLNPQAVYGADVISRIQCAMNGELPALTAAIRRGMSELIQNCCLDTGISPEEIGVISVVGNPCMQQLFLGIQPKNLSAVPFAPVLTKAQICPAVDYFPECKNAVFLIVPDISGYVGADTIGCILATQMYQAEDTVLMVDIGTNGEMVLSHKGKMVACSTAAGPALEGANIQFGMRGAKGAIDHVWLDNGKLSYSVIGGDQATGICGSGIIDAVAVMLEQKVLNKRGRMDSSEEFNGIRAVRLSEAVWLTQEDICQVQMAKGAIAAGIHMMCCFLGITVQEVDRVILTGAFGSFLNPESACRIGLLPGELAGRITAAGNIAGTGARMLAVNRSQLPLTEQLLKRIEFLELAKLPEFQRTFARCMTFSD